MLEIERKIVFKAEASPSQIIEGEKYIERIS
jgi:hypothetical protein